MTEKAEALPQNRVELKTGTYDIKVVRRSPEGLIKEDSLIRIPNQYGKEISVAISGNRISIADAGSVVHLNERTLAEKNFRSILLGERFSIVPHNPESITEVIDQTLQTTAEISPGLEYNPTRYLQSVLEELDILEHVQEKDLRDINKIAAAAFLMDTLGYFRVEKQIDPFTGETLPDEEKEISRTPEELRVISQKIKCDYKTVADTFEQIKKIRQATRHSKGNPERVIESLKKPEKERTNKLARFDLAFGLPYIAIAYNDLFGKSAAFEFLTSYFGEDIRKEYELEGRLKQALTGSGAVFKTPTQEEVEKAIEIHTSYNRLKEKLGKELPKRIIEANLNEMELLTGLHFYRDTIIIDPTDTLPLISEYEVIERTHKSESGEKTKTRHYFLKGKEISLARAEGKTRYFNYKKRIKEEVSSQKEISEKPVLLEFEEEVRGCTKKTVRKDYLAIAPGEDSVEQVNAAFQTAKEESEKGRKIKVYLYGDEIEETKQLRILAEHPSAIDAVAVLKKSGDFGKIGILDVGEIGNGIEERINFNDIFLFAKYGIAPRREFQASEAGLLSKLEKMVNEQHEFEIKPDNQIKYHISIGSLRLGEILLPENITIETLTRMNLLEALSKQKTEKEDSAERLKADKFIELYDLMPEEFKMPNQDIEAIQYLIDLEREHSEPASPKISAGENPTPIEETKVSPKIFVGEDLALIEETRKSLEGKAHKASIRFIDAQRENKKRYIVKRKTLGSEAGYEDLGVITTNNDISRINRLSLNQYGSISGAEREDLVSLTKAKFTGIEYSPENGGVWIEKRERLEQVVEKFYQIIGKTAEEMGIDLTFIRITDRARKRFHDQLLDNYQDKILDKDEKASLDKEMKLLGINPDQVRKMFFHTEYLLERGLMEPTLSLLAGFVEDSHLDLIEGALTEWYIKMLEAENINKDLLAFINARARNSVDTIAHASPEIQTMLKYVENSIIRDNRSKEDDKKLLKALALLEIPPHQKEDAYTTMRTDYEAFATDFSARVVHIPNAGESVPQARFFKFYHTTKDGIKQRANQLGDVANKLVPIEKVFYNSIFFGLGEEDIAKYVQAMVGLDKDTRKMIVSNMSTYADSQDLMKRYRGRFLRELNEKILSEETMKFVTHHNVIGHALEFMDNAIDSVIPSEDGETTPNGPAIPVKKSKDAIMPAIVEQVFELKKRLFDEYTREDEEEKRTNGAEEKTENPSLNITDEDWNNTFGEENGAVEPQKEPPKDETDFGDLND